ncbi:MAG: leucine--tRNA ligase [Bdellovibrionaceae bacterium]|nr:leucine--tRNA ligase [Pseudobdellovibrionaceae bacterium]
MAYSHQEIDSKWQDLWTKNQIYKAEFPSTKPKYYALDMFPYPSAKGLHVGHLASYTPTDVVSRYKRAQGFNVLHPMGFDAFGLPAEQFAIQTGTHPALTTEEAINNFRRQMDAFGFSFDWDRSLSTADPKFYKWTQFIFTELYKKGLAYQKEVPVNWCPALKTVLANEEVVDGKSERGGHPVIRMPMKQWMLKITDYSEPLLQGLDTVDFPDRTKEGQKNWIGKSLGAEIRFAIKGEKTETLTVFTTRPDTLFGATFMVLAPEHPAVLEITPTEKLPEVKAYIDSTSRKSEVDRKAAKEKSGCFTGAFAIHPITKKELPIWIADYVLIDYGSGAIMAVPGHDERDFEFAQKYGLEIVRVVEGGDELPYSGDGQMVNSDFLNGLSKEDAIKKMVSHLENQNLGHGQVQYKLRDWLFSRQRYWGEPIPVVKNIKDGSIKPLSLAELPVELPEVANYEPSESGEAPLARNTAWVNYSEDYTREVDTMPGSAGSSWYFLRYTDPHNENELASPEAQKYWMPVDLYLGGPEHTVGHLLYSRFWQRFLYEQGHATTPEPYAKLAHQGMILGPDGEKMSKSRGNVINPDDVKADFGADAIRVYICFMGPYDRDKPWSTDGIYGVRRFLDRIWRLCLDEDQNVQLQDGAEFPEDAQKVLHKTIKKVAQDIESLNFNTAVSAMMIYTNELYKLPKVSKEMVLPLIQILAPFAPHFCEELWQRLGQTGFVCVTPWPQYDENLCVDNLLVTAVQVNGKTRGTIDVEANTSEDEALKLAHNLKTVQAQLEGKNIVKVIYKPGRILNIIAK